MGLDQLLWEGVGGSYRRWHPLYFPSGGIMKATVEVALMSSRGALVQANLQR